MKSLSEIFESVKNQLHFGPALEPFHRGVIWFIEKLHDENKALRKELNELKDRFEAAFPTHSGEPQYISPPLSIMKEAEVEAPEVAPAQTQAAGVLGGIAAMVQASWQAQAAQLQPDVGQAQLAAVQAMTTAAPDDAASLVEQPAQPNAAAPESTEMSSPPSAPADPVPAAPDVTTEQSGTTPETNPAELPITPSTVSSAQPDAVSAGPETAAPTVMESAPAADTAAAPTDTNQGA